MVNKIVCAISIPLERVKVKLAYFSYSPSNELISRSCNIFNANFIERNLIILIFELLYVGTSQQAYLSKLALFRSQRCSEF